jgi:hypothetical protein
VTPDKPNTLLQNPLAPLPVTPSAKGGNENPAATSNAHAPIKSAMHILCLATMLWKIP